MSSPNRAGTSIGVLVARRFRAVYGAGPWHLVTLLIALALGAYTLTVLGLSTLWNPDVWWQSILVWFLGAVIVHDLVLFPLYAGADRVLSRIMSRRDHVGADSRRPPAVNHVRIPVMAIALLFLLFFPGILEQGADNYVDATGQTQDPFLQRWLLLSAVIVGISIAAYAIRWFLRSSDTAGPHVDAGPEPQ